MEWSASSRSKASCAPSGSTRSSPHIAPGRSRNSCTASCGTASRSTRCSSWRHSTSRASRGRSTASWPTSSFGRCRDPRLCEVPNVPEVRHLRRDSARPSAGDLQRWRTPAWRISMSVVTRFSPESLTSDQYDLVVRRLDEENISPADGLDYELCFGSGDKMKVSLVWDSKEQFDAFAARLMPILAEVGVDPGEPEVFEVHNIIKGE